MLNKIISFADEHNMFPDSGNVLVCVSGGADSMCLLEALLAISPERGFGVSAAHFNHRLRGEESLRDEIFVREYCDMRGVQYFIGEGDIRAYAKKHNLGIEEAARKSRYNFFFAQAEETGSNRIATGHTADDNAETMIINFARGAGTAGLSGIPPKRRDIRNPELRVPNAHPKSEVVLIRPMLSVTKDEVMRFAAQRGIPFVDDSTNNLDIYTRNKVRHYVVPVLREINPKFAQTAEASSALLRADEEYISKVADEFIKTHVSHEAMESKKSELLTQRSNPIPYSLFPIPLRSQIASVDARQLAELPFAVSGRVVRKLCHGRGLSYIHVKAILDLCNSSNPSACLSLPGMTVYREYGLAVFSTNAQISEDSFIPIYPTDGDSIVIPGLGLKLSCKSVVHSGIISKSLTTFQFKSADICGRMIVRPRRKGDSIKLFGRNETKTLKKLFIERRVSVRKREMIPIIADDSGVLAIYGLGVGERAIPELGDSAVQISFELQLTNDG